MNVLVVSTTFIPSVLLCGHCQLEYLEKQGKCNYKFVISHFINQKNVEWADIFVFLRSDSYNAIDVIFPNVLLFLDIIVL